MLSLDRSEHPSEQPKNEKEERKSSLFLSKEKKDAFTKDFIKYMNISLFIGDYAIPFVLIAFFLCAIIICPIVLLLDDLDEYWYITFSIVSLLIFVVVGFIGFRIKKKRRKTTLGKLIDFVFNRLVHWTNKKIKETEDINEKRFFFENLLNTYYDYTKFKDINLWSKEQDLHTLYNIIDSRKNHDVIGLTLNLFKKVYIGEDDKYTERGVLIILKILETLKYLSNRADICARITRITKKFMYDTKMDVFKSKVTNRKIFKPDEMIWVNQGIFKHGNNYLQLFEDLWMVDDIKATNIQSEITSITQTVATSIRNLRLSKRKKTLVEIDLKKELTLEKNESDQKSPSIEENNEVEQKEILVEKNTFGITSKLFSILKQKKSKKDKKDKKKDTKKDKKKENNTIYFDILKNNENNKMDPIQIGEVKHMPSPKFVDNELISDKNRKKRKNGSSSNGYSNEKNYNKKKDLFLSIEQIESIEDIKSKTDDVDSSRIIMDSKNGDPPLKRKSSFSVNKLDNTSIINIRNFEIPKLEEEKNREIDPDTIRFFNLAMEPQENFKLMTNKKGVKVFKRFDDGNPIILVRCDATVKGNVDKIFELLYDLEKRENWDTIFCKMKVLKILNENTDVVYSYIKAPIMITNRDFLQKRMSYHNYEGFEYVIAFVSVEDNDFPPVKRTIRANTSISGYALRKINEDETYLVTLSQSDIKGLIPKAILNSAAAKAPYDWVKKLEKAVKNNS